MSMENWMEQMNGRMWLEQVRETNQYTEKYGLTLSPEDTEILINGTSAGFSPNVDERPDIDYSTVTEKMCVCDVVFNPVETVFLREAAKCGAKTVTGLGMLVQQAALNFALWTGEEAPVDVMEEALRREFE